MKPKKAKDELGIPTNLNENPLNRPKLTIEDMDEYMLTDDCEKL